MTKKSHLSLNYDDLSKCDEKVPLFTIIGVHEAKIVKVHDGDTVHAVIKFQDKYQKFIIRLNNIDTDELLSIDPVKKANGILARDTLSTMILDKIVSLECFGFDKYGRLLGVITLNNICINNELIKLNLAKEYHGGTKE